MKKFTVIDPLYMSFYSRDLYRDVARNWSTLGCFLYLLSLLAICWIPGMIRLDTDLAYYLNNNAPKYISQMPDISLSKGEASIRGPQPYLIKDPENGELFMIIDTTGGIRSLEGSKASVLLTKDRLIVGLKEDNRDAFDQRSFDLRDFTDETITRPLMYQWLERFTEWFGLLVYPFAVLFSFLFRTAQTLIIAFLGIILAKTLKVDLTYGELVRISAIAVTPLIMFNALALFFRAQIPAPMAVDIVLATGYLFFAVNSNRGRTEA
jgi:hypothetical protein